MRYSDDLIEEVRSRNDIVDLIGGYVHLKRTGSNYVGLCPFHNEKTASFSVSRQKQMYYCFGCHAGGNVFTFMMEYNSMTFVEAVQFLAERSGVDLPKMDYSEEARELADRKSALLAIHKEAATYYFHMLRREEGAIGLSYLKNRGLSDETIRKFGLGFATRKGGLYRHLKKKGYSDELLSGSGLFTFDEQRGVLDKFWNRVMFPIQDVRGRVIGFGGRVMGDGLPKYVNSPDTDLFNKGYHLFGLNIARSTRRKYIILCEGYMDVITMHQAGFDNAVASLGTALTGQQANLLRRFADTALLLYDSDGAGRTAAIRAYPILKNAGISARVVDLSPHKDPDEFIRALGNEAMEERLLHAEDAFMFEVADLEGRYRLDDPQERTAFQREVAVRLLGFPEDLERENYIEAVSKKYYMKPEALRKLVNTMALEGKTPARRQAQTSPERDEAAKMAGKENGFVKSEKLMLTYLANYPEAYALTKDYVGPDDFSDPLCHLIAERLYAQLAEGKANEASLVSQFSDAGEQRMVAELFHTTIETNDPKDQNIVFTDTVVRIMTASNERKFRDLEGQGMEAIYKQIEGKKRIEAIRNSGKVFELVHLP
ncbi:MAG: DNA primase [Lachnospiraceae bacterium]|nr:DNA primase [Lachnospiraceae bacterium]